MIKSENQIKTQELKPIERSEMKPPQANNEQIECQMKKESTHCTLKLFFCILMLVILLVVALLRGSGQEPSFAGVQRCDPLDHTLFALLILAGLVLTLVATVIVRKEYLHKQAIGYPFAPNEIRFTNRTILRLAGIGFTAGFLNAGFGLGTTFVINPALISLD